MVALTNHQGHRKSSIVMVALMILVSISREQNRSTITYKIMNVGRGVTGLKERLGSVVM